MDNTINKIIEEEEIRLERSTSPIDKLNILYNIIKSKKSIGNANHNYRDIKKLVDYYIELIKISDFGYDSFNYNKLKEVLSFLTHKEQISILKYSLSSLARELPEYDKEWFLKELNKAEIKKIFSQKEFLNYPKAFFLFAGMNIKGLLIALFFFIGFVFVILLPAPVESWVTFKITYENYCSNFYLNHLLNIVSLFSDLDNDFKVTPQKWLGLVAIVLAKGIFVILIVNFIYKKVSDKISIK